MTKKEFFTKVSLLNDAELAGYAQEQLENMARADSLRKSKPTKAQIENAPLINELVSNVLEADAPMTAGDIADAMGISVQKASALCRQLLKEERVVVTDVPVKGRGVQKGYSLSV